MLCARRIAEDVPMKPLINSDETKRERALRVMTTGWCPWPYLGATAPGDTGLDYKAECRCGKRVRVTARGLLSHHKMLRCVSKDEVRRR
jgi:hypothetical protein